MSLNNNQLEERILAIELMLNRVQTALGNVPTKQTLNGLTMIRQQEIDRVNKRLEILEGSLFSNKYYSTSFVNQLSVNIVHNFGNYPVVQVIDGLGAELIPDNVINNTINDFTVYFSQETTGVIIATIGSDTR